MERMNMSARAHDHILKAARTIADLEDAALDVLDHLSRGAHRPYHGIDRPTYLGSNL